MCVQKSLDDAVWSLRNAITRLENIDTDLQTPYNVDYEISSAISDLYNVLEELKG